VLAKLGKLDVWAAAHGLPLKNAPACLNSKTAMDMVVANRNQAVNVFGLTGTPTFVINGKTVAGVYEWSALEPKLVEALR
jgi:protein-disulfide isomerase